MPGLSGLDLVRHLAGDDTAPPIALITGHGDIDMAVAAIKLGADDFIEKPFDEARLLESIHKAAGKAHRRHGESGRLEELRARHASLSARQRQVMELAATGRSEEHTSELQSLMRISYAVFCLKKKKTKYSTNSTRQK